jgi:hypothetical protein
MCRCIKLGNVKGLVRNRTVLGVKCRLILWKANSNGPWTQNVVSVNRLHVECRLFAVTVVNVKYGFVAEAYTTKQ